MSLCLTQKKLKTTKNYESYPLVMSSLIFELNTDCINVATDTLATLPDGSPAVFSTKAMYLPHLRMIVAGTGVAGIWDSGSKK